MTEKKSSPKAILVMAIVLWLGAAVSLYRINTQFRKQDGDLFDAILMTVVFSVFAVVVTIRYRNAKKNL